MLLKFDSVRNDDAPRVTRLAVLAHVEENRVGVAAVNAQEVKRLSLGVGAEDGLPRVFI